MKKVLLLLLSVLFFSQVPYVSSAAPKKDTPVSEFIKALDNFFRTQENIYNADPKTRYYTQKELAQIAAEIKELRIVNGTYKLKKADTNEMLQYYDAIAVKYSTEGTTPEQIAARRKEIQEAKTLGELIGLYNVWRSYSPRIETVENYKFKFPPQYMVLHSDDNIEDGVILQLMDQAPYPAHIYLLIVVTQMEGQYGMELSDREKLQYLEEEVDIVYDHFLSFDIPVKKSSETSVDNIDFIATKTFEGTNNGTPYVGRAESFYHGIDCITYLAFGVDDDCLSDLMEVVMPYYPDTL